MAEKEYIEREAVLNDIGELFTLCSETLPNEAGHHFIVEKELETHLNFVRNLPAADVRPVVFCRDCIHYKPQQKSARWSNATPMCSRSATIKMPPDGFCSFGVKREES